MKKLIFSIFVLAGVGVPLLFTPFLFSGFELGKAILLRLVTMVALLLIVFVAIRDAKFGWIKVSKKFWITLGVFILVNILACVFSIAPMLSFWGSYERQHGLLQLIYYVSFFFLFISFIEKKDVRKIIYWMCATGTAIALIAILQNYFGIFLSIWDTSVLVGRLAIGTLGQPNFLASYLLMLIPFFVIFCGDNKGWRKYLWLAGLVLALWAILVTLSRGALVGIFAMMIFMGVFYKKKLLVIPVLIMSMILLANIFVGQTLVRENKLLSRLILDGESLRSVESRLEIWPATLKMIERRPILGYGQEVFKESFLKFAPQRLLEIEDTHEKADRAHNEILDITSSIGIVGLLSYLALLFGIIKLGVDKRKDSIIFASSSSLLALFANNMFEFSTTTNYVLWWLILGIIVVIGGEKHIVNLNIFKKKLYYYLVSIIAIFVALFISLFTIINPVIADYHYNEGQPFAAGLLYFSAVDNFKKAAEYNPYEVYYSIRGAEFAIIGAQNTPEYFYHNSLVSRADWFLGKIDKLGAGDFAQTLRLKGKEMTLRNAPDLAVEFLLSANEKAPTDLLILLDLADAYVWKNAPGEAMDVYRKYLKLMPYWNEVFVILQAGERDKFLFRTFFKSNSDFTSILRRIASVADSVGMPLEANKYRTYADKIEMVMKTLTN